MVRVPDLDHMIMIEELHASNVCIHCGEKKALHHVVYQQIPEMITPGGMVVWRCYPNRSDTFKSVIDAST